MNSAARCTEHRYTVRFLSAIYQLAHHKLFDPGAIFMVVTTSRLTQIVEDSLQS